MKINKPSKKSKNVALILFASFFVLLGIWCFYAKSNSMWPFVNSNDHDTSSSETTDSGDVDPAPARLSPEDAKGKEEFIQNQDKVKSSTNQSSPRSSVQNEESNRIKTSLSAQQKDLSSITVFTKIYNVADGECKLLVEKGDQSVTKTAKVMYQPDYSTCAGFSIDKNELGAGLWTFILTVNSESSEGKSTASLEVK